MPRLEKVPGMGELMAKLKRARKEAVAMLTMTQKQYKYQADCHHIPGPDIKLGDIVFLSRKDIVTQRPSEKLDHRCL